MRRCAYPRPLWRLASAFWSAGTSGGGHGGIAEGDQAGGTAAPHEPRSPGFDGTHGGLMLFDVGDERFRSRTVAQERDDGFSGGWDSFVSVCGGALFRARPGVVGRDRWSMPAAQGREEQAQCEHGHSERHQPSLGPQHPPDPSVGMTDQPTHSGTHGVSRLPKSPLDRRYRHSEGVGEFFCRPTLASSEPDGTAVLVEGCEHVMRREPFLDRRPDGPVERRGVATSTAGVASIARGNVPTHAPHPTAIRRPARWVEVAFASEHHQEHILLRIIELVPVDTEVPKRSPDERAVLGDLVSKGHLTLVTSCASSRFPSDAQKGLQTRPVRRCCGGGGSLGSRSCSDSSGGGVRFDRPEGTHARLPRARQQ